MGEWTGPLEATTSVQREESHQCGGLGMRWDAHPDEKVPDDGFLGFNLPIFRLLEEFMELPTSSGVVQKVPAGGWGSWPWGCWSISLGLSLLAAWECSKGCHLLMEGREERLDGAERDEVEVVASGEG